MPDDSIGWEDAVQETSQEEAVNLELSAVPVNWQGWTRAAKVQLLVDVVQHYLQKVRMGTFNPRNGESLAALALEGQMELAPFYADAESSAKNAKHLVDYAEGEVAAKYAQEASNSDIKVTEASLKRMASISDEAKQAKSRLVELEKEHKKWRYVYDVLREAHIFFRNIGKL